MRKSDVTRKTSETLIEINLSLDQKGESSIDTGIGFFDHMLTSFSKHSGIDLIIKARGDLNVDFHHTIEDTGLVLGEALFKALNTKIGINRYSSFIMCMDDALVLCSIDLSGRSYFEMNYHFSDSKVGDFDTILLKEFFTAFTNNLKANIHFLVMRGNNTHHIIEACFKCLGKCMKDAIKIVDNNLLSTKGLL